MNENSVGQNPCAFLMSSLGPKNCLGMRFSVCELKFCISNLVAKVGFVPCEKTTKYEDLKYGKNDALGQVEGGLWIKCEER